MYPFTKKPRYHDYRVRSWGHDYVYTPRNEGKEASMIGWGRGIEQGDILVLKGPNGGGSGYRVDRIRYFRDPTDMWEAEVSYVEPDTTQTP